MYVCITIIHFYKLKVLFGTSWTHVKVRICFILLGERTLHPQSDSLVTTVMLIVFSILVVLGILYFLFGTNRGREIITRDSRGTDTAGGGGLSDCLIDSEICV